MRNKIRSLLLLPQLMILIMIPLMMACTNPEKSENRMYGIMLKGLLSDSVPAITVGELKQNPEKYVLIDARAKEEFEVSRLKGAIHVSPVTVNPAQEMPSHVKKSTPVVVYCSVGYRSEKLTELLLENGYQNVRNLYGGIFEWVNRGHEIVNSTGVTDKVHPYNTFWGVWLREGERVYK